MSKTIKPHGRHTIFLNFVEEFWPRHIVEHMGRVEVEMPGDNWPSEEIRFATSDPAWYKFRDKWDFRYVTAAQLERVRREIADKYCWKMQT